MNLVKKFTAARNCSVPLLLIESPDIAATMTALSAELDGHAVPIFCWDAIQGLVCVSLPAQSWALSEPEGSTEGIAKVTKSPTEALKKCALLPSGSAVFFCYLGRLLDNPVTLTALWLLRDAYKSDQRMLVGLAPSFAIPEEIRHDVVLLSEEYPDDAQLTRIAEQELSAAEQDVGRIANKSEQIERAVVALRGSSAYAAEQATALAMCSRGIDFGELWAGKRKQISQIDGLSLDKPDLSFADIGGLGSIKQYLRGLAQGPNRPRVVVRIEEIEKALAGSGSHGDSSGVSQDMLATILTAMEDYGWGGLIALGPGGSGKSLLCKAAGTTFEVPSLTMDLGAMRDKHVGESGRKIRQALAVLKAIGQSDVFFIASCNDLSAISAPLKRRFYHGLFYFDIPSREELIAIWKVNLSRYGFGHDDLAKYITFSTGWTGAEVRNCCRIAQSLTIAPSVAAVYIVPVSKSDPQELEALREQAHGRFLSASEPGVYQHPNKKEVRAANRKRNYQLQKAS
jgi:hypothetical protein